MEANCLDMPIEVPPKRHWLPSFKSPRSSTTEDPSTESNVETPNLWNPSASSSKNWTKGESSDSHPGEFRRTSLCKQFDPLHSTGLNLHIRSKSYVDALTGVIEPFNVLPKSANADFSKTITGKNLSTMPSEDTLISFVSPKKLPRPLSPKNLFVHDPKSYKRYSEEEFSQILKTQKDRLEKEFEIKFKTFQDCCTEKEQELERELSGVERLNRSYYSILKECGDILDNTVARNDEIESRTRSLQIENEKLKNDIKTTKEDCSNMETVFSDVHKRYEKCKSMIKSYKENEECLMTHIESARESLEEKSRMYDVLDSRSRELKDQAVKLIETEKKSAEMQVVVLETQLKKTEMKAYSTEYDLKQSKLENENFQNIYDDLVSKIGK